MSDYQASEIHFCHQTWHLNATVIMIAPWENGVDVIVDRTPFHPVSHIWPDHPADQGELVVEQATYSLENCLVGAIEQATGTLYVDKAIPVKRDTPGWAFVVVHRLADEADNLTVGCKVELQVNKPHQQALSRGHSAGHVAYLALNKVLAEGYWRKEADRKDPLGHADFNSYAQVTSFVTPNRCHDTYRLGKTLRKRGLNSADVLAQLSDIEHKVNQQVKTWLDFDGKVTIHCAGDTLTDSRYWQCQLEPELHVSTPCGGTHIEQLSELEVVEVTLCATDGQNIEMHTNVKVTDRI